MGEGVGGRAGGGENRPQVKRVQRRPLVVAKMQSWTSGACGTAANGTAHDALPRVLATVGH